MHLGQLQINIYNLINLISIKLLGELVKISNTFFPQKRKQGEVECPYCGYVIAKPYPKDQLCPKCKKFLAVIFDLTSEKDEKQIPKEFKTKTSTLSSKLGAKVKVKEQPLVISLDSDKIKLKKGEYIKLMGITSTERTPLYCSNDNYAYLLELTNSILTSDSSDMVIDFSFP